MHYCMGQMIGWGLGKGNSNMCGNCGMKESKQQQKACCTDEQKFVKDYSDQNISKPLFNTQQTVAVALTKGFIEIYRSAFYSFRPLKFVSASPSGCKNVALYLFQRAFLL